MSGHSLSKLLGMKPSACRKYKNKEVISLFENSKNKHRILACDTEDNSKGRTLMVNFFDGENHFTFRNTDTAVDWLLATSSQYKSTEVWFANSQYDIGNIFRTSQEYLSFTLSGSRFIVGKIYKERIKFKDIFNVMPGASVKTLGKMIGLEKIEVHGEFDNEEYCQRDTEIVFWAYVSFKHTLKKLNVELKNTAASTSFTALLKTYERLAVNSLTESDHEFMKQGYYGGRTEVFHTAKIEGEIYGYDIVSSYPYCMTKIPLVDTSSRIYTTSPKIFNREGMVECIVEAPESIEIPYLPVKHDNKLIFPIGTFHGVWTYFEIREAIKLGYKVKEYIKALEFKTIYDFTLKEFVDKLFAIRAEAKEKGDDVLQYVCKILLNACYGKFAMGNEKTELLAFEEFFKIKGDYSSELFPNNQIIVKKTTKHAPSTNYLTASLITAYGRHNLYQYLLRGNNEKRTLLYCDTDSIFYRGPKLDDLGLKKGSLGQLQLEYELKSAWFILPKTYMLVFNRALVKDGDKITEVYKCKGVRGNLAKEFFTKGYAESMQPLKYVETCRKNFFITERNKKYGTNEPLIPFNMWVNKPKSLKAGYTKRQKTQNGKTKPVILNFNVETGKNE